MLGPGVDLPPPQLLGTSSHSKEPGAGARENPEAAMVRTRACSRARTSPEVAGARSWMSFGGAERGSRRVASIARRPSAPRKWAETAVVPARVKVQAAAANIHDRNAQDVLAQLVTYNPMGGVARLPEQSEGADLRRRVRFDHVQALPHLKKGPASTARQSALLHSPPSHPMRTRFGRGHSLLHSQHFCLKESPRSDRPQTTHTPPRMLAPDSLNFSGHVSFPGGHETWFCQI